MSFTNLYYKRTAGTDRACYVCYKPTTTVLATLNTVDFIYTCDTHLTDPGFASQVGESSDGIGAGGVKKMGLSPEEIAKIKEEYEEHQKIKREKEKEKEKTTEKKDDDDGKKKPETTKNTTVSTMPGALAVGTSTAPSSPTHQRYTLHRDIFALRLAEHRKRRQAAQAKALAPRLPGAPRNSLPSDRP